MTILTPGSVIGKYHVVNQLSAGGMGLIYRAVHPVLGTQVAIKTIRPELAKDPAIVERFLNEAMSASRIRDPRLPVVYDQDTLECGTPYMVMELLHGEDLSVRLAKGPMRPADAARIMVEILEVLEKVHVLGIIHRDMKPQNIFLARDEVFGEVPKLLDFGVAHFVNEAQRQTRPGEMMGTPLYMAVEQTQKGGEINACTDVFSAGVVLYECIAGMGERPWGDGRALAYVTALNLGTPARPLQQIAPKSCPSALCELVMKAVELDPNDRFQSAAEFARALEPYARARGARYRSRKMPGASSPVQRPTNAPTVAPVVDAVSAQASAIHSSGAMRKLRAKLSSMRDRPAGEGGMRSGERRHVYVLALRFGVVQNPGLSLEESDLELVREEVAQIFRQSLESENAKVDAAMGNTLTATFGHDRMREDSARSALAAAHDVMRRRNFIDSELVELGCSIHVRVGLHCGFIIQTGGARPTTLAAAATEVAVSLADQSPRNSVLVTEPFRRAAEAFGDYRTAGPLQRPGQKAIATFEARESVGIDWLSTPDLPLIGRVAEHAALMASLNSDGPSRLVCVTGMAGVGKSRFIRALGEGSDDNWVVTWAAPVPLRPFGLMASLVQSILFGVTSTRPTTWLLQSRLESLARDLDGMEGARLRDYGEECALLLGRRVVQDAPHAEAATIQGELGAFIGLLLTAYVSHVAKDGARLAVVFDQLQEADVASIRLLEGLADQLSDVPVRLIVARRPSERIEFPSHVPVDEIDLGPLTAPDVDTMIDALVPSISESARALIHDRAQGNPLFVAELIQTLGSNALLDAPTQRLEHFPLPWHLYGVLLARVDRLSPEHREAVRCLAVIGDPVDPAVWAAVYRAMRIGGTGPVRDPRKPLRALDEAGVIRCRIEEGVERWVFVQPLLRDAVYDTVLPDNRRALHLVCAQTIESIPDKDTLARDVRLLHHYRNTDGVERTLHYARRVGRGALGLGASDDAGAALDLAVTLQTQGELEPPMVRAGTLIDAAWARFYLGRLESAIQAGIDATALLEVGAPRRPTNDDEGRGLVMLARAHMVVANAATYRADWELAPTQLEQAEYLFELAGKTEDSARARCQLGFVLRSMGRAADGVEMARDGYDVLRASNNQVAFVRAAHDFGNILRDIGQHAEAIAVFDEAIAVGEDLAAIGRHFGAKWALAARSGRAMALAAVGRLDEAAQAQREVYDEVLRRRHLVAQAVSACHLAGNYLALKRNEEAQQFAEIALEVAGRVQMPRRSVRARLLLGELANRNGDGQGALTHLEAAEFLARAAETKESHVGDGLWFEVLEPLLAALSADGRIARVMDTLEEATVRAERRGDEALVQRVNVLRLQFGPAADEMTVDIDG